MRSLSDVFVKCFELASSLSICLNIIRAAPPHKPKRKQEKKRQKKRKKKATILSGEVLGCQGFLEKNTTS